MFKKLIAMVALMTIGSTAALAENCPNSNSTTANYSAVGSGYSTTYQATTAVTTVTSSSYTVEADALSSVLTAQPASTPITSVNGENAVQVQLTNPTVRQAAYEACFSLEKTHFEMIISHNGNNYLVCHNRTTNVRTGYQL